MLKPNRLWISIIAPCIAIAFVLALFIGILGAVAGAAVGGQEPGGSAEPQTPPQMGQAYEGMITDTQCGAKHSATMGKTARDCALVCVRGGAKFALVDGNKTYILEGDLALLKRVAGQRASIRGDLTGNTIKVSSLAAKT